MTFSDVMGLLGGLALFLYGMQMMSSGLENVAGNKMKQILEKLTANRFLGVLVGAGITAVIQSSSASVGILQALANSGVIGLGSAAFVLFGQNIGTCVTALSAKSSFPAHRICWHPSVLTVMPAVPQSCF